MKLFAAYASLALALIAISSPATSAEVTAKPSPPSPAAPQKYALQYKFAAGEVLRYSVEHATNVRTTIDDSTQQAETRSDSVKSWKVTDVLPGGEMEFIHLVEWVRMSNETPLHPANVYDSRTDGKPPRGFEQAAGAVGVPLSLIRIASDGEVKFREEKHPQPRTSEDMPITLRLPKDPVAIGEKWSNPYDVQANRKGGAKIQVRTRRVCKLRDVQTGVAVIDVEYQILTPVDQYVRSQLIERLTEGTVRFDVERGRVIQQEHNVDKRVLGFAGQTSSMHFVSRLHEELLKSGEQTAKIQQASANLPK